jgi:predicted nuclease of predicted toxin-antitoxin system
VKITLDENFDVRLVPLLAEEGHDVETVPAERLSGSPDETIYEVCRAEGRTLITLDMDSANPFRFPPEPTEGIVVVRPPRPVLSAIRATLVSVLGELRSRPLTGVLWIVEPGRIRVYDPPGDSGERQDATDESAAGNAGESAGDGA